MFYDIFIELIAPWRGIIWIYVELATRYVFARYGDRSWDG